jgi:hypothetical protein
VVCAVCRRDVRTDPRPRHALPSWLEPWREHAYAERACSVVCLGIISMRDQPMIDPTEGELAAIEDASDKAGEYLDELNQTDLAKLSREQWLELIQVIVTAFTDKLREIEGAVPARL